MKGIPPTRGLAALAAILCSVVATVSARDSLADLDSFRSGCQALEDGRFESAAEHFRATWSQLESGDSGDIERDFVTSRLLESLVRNGAPSEASAWVRKNPPLDPSADTMRWAALALQRERAFAEAANYYEKLAAAGELDRSLALHRVACLALGGRPESAFQILEDGLEPRNAKESFRFARIADRAGEPETALAYLDRLVSEGAPDRLRFPVARLRCSVLEALDRRPEALETALNLVDASPNPREAHRAFLLLEEIGVEATATGVAGRLEAWRRDEEHPAAAAADFFESLWLSEGKERREFLETFARERAGTPLAGEARLRLARMVEKATPWDEAADRPARLPGGAARLDFERSAAAYRREKFAEASEQFLGLAGRQQGEDRRRSLHNAALAALRSGDFASFSSIRDRLTQSNPDSPYLADLSYLGGLYQAAQGNPNAFELLQSFVREHPDHPSNVEARLALAEIHLNQVPARPQAAREIFGELRVRPLTLAQSERLDYTAVWAEVIDDDKAALVERSEAFLRDWPSSDYLPEVAMLLAKQQFRERNPEAARRTFTLVANRFPDSRFAETARFFAARSAPPGEEAIEEWRRLIEADGPFATRARHELALLLLSLDRFEEAGRELGKVVEAVPADAPLRFAAMADLGFVHYMEALTLDSDPQLLERAADAFARLSSMREAPAVWRYNAAVRRGKCLEALGNAPVALEIYRSIVNETETRSGSLSSTADLREAQWIFRAGFAAIRILQEKQDWSAAIGLADALAEKEGSRAIEAARLAERMRLEHWVWE